MSNRETAKKNNLLFFDEIWKQNVFRKKNVKFFYDAFNYSCDLN